MAAQITPCYLEQPGISGNASERSDRPARVLSLLVQISREQSWGKALFKANIPAGEKYLKRKPRLSFVLKSPSKYLAPIHCDGTIVARLE